jgi:hypothetical protein
VLVVNLKLAVSQDWLARNDSIAVEVLLSLAVLAVEGLLCLLLSSSSSSKTFSSYGISKERFFC